MRQMTEPKIEGRVSVTQNGPYAVTGNIPLAKQTIATNAQGDSWKSGRRATATRRGRNMRCAAAVASPTPSRFCDGTHAKVGFYGTVFASREPYLNQPRPSTDRCRRQLTQRSLLWLGAFCDPNGKVWNLVAHTDDPAVRTMFERQVNNCPAGRLVAWDKVSGQVFIVTGVAGVDRPGRRPGGGATGGPIWLRGGIAACRAADGWEYEFFRATA